IARTSLLDREAEVDVGERIATADRTIAREALGSAPGVRYVLSLRERLESGQVRARDLVRVDSDDPGGEDTARRRLLAGLARVRTLVRARQRSSRTGRKSARCGAEALRTAGVDLALGPGTAPVAEVVTQLEEIRQRSQRVAMELAPLHARRELKRLKQDAGMSMSILDDVLAAIRSAQQQVCAAKRVLIESNLRLVAT